MSDDSPSSDIVQKSVSKILANVQPSVRDFLTPIVSLNEAGQFYEPTCRFCTHPLREKAETFYQSLDKTMVTRCEKLQTWFLVDMGEADMPLDLIRNHINNHMGRGDAEFRKVEYVNKITNLSSVEMSTIHRIKFALAALSERITAIGACSSFGPKATPLESEAIKTKSINDLLKTWTSLVALQSELMGEMLGKGEVISIHKEDFDRIVGHAITCAKNDDERQLIAQLLDELEKCDLEKATSKILPKQ